MVRWFRRLSIASRIFAGQLAAILVLATVAVAVATVDAHTAAGAEAGRLSLAVAKGLAEDPSVQDALGTEDPSALLEDYSLRVAAATGVDFITIMAPDRRRYTHPDRDMIGKKFIGSIDRALAGQAFVETYTGTLGPSVRAVAPVERDGEVVALVAAGITVSSLLGALDVRIGSILLAVAATILLATAGFWLLSRYLHRVTGGRGPEEMSRMLASYEGVLHSIGDGLVLQDARGGVVLMNDRALVLFGLADARAEPPRPVREALEIPAPASGRIVLTDERLLVVDRHPAHARPGQLGRSARSGTVTIVRDHTELQELAGELRTMTTLSDALRSQAHEFANRLHTIIALIELGRPEQAVALASDEARLSQALADRLLRAVDEPVLVALLLGKASQAAERSVAFDVELPERLPPTGLDPRDLITVVGNLVDNALDAAADAPPARVLVGVRARGRTLEVTVEDSGPGPAEGARAFVLGETTKTAPAPLGRRGMGLALVRMTVARLGGEIAVTGSRFRVLLPMADADG